MQYIITEDDAKKLMGQISSTIGESSSIEGIDFTFTTTKPYIVMKNTANTIEVYRTITVTGE